MYRFPIGVIIKSFRTDTRSAIRKAVEIGADGIQVYAAGRETTPEKLTAEDRRELLDFVTSHGLNISALCGDFGKGFTDRALNPELIEKSKRILELAKDLGTDIVTTHIGRFRKIRHMKDTRSCRRLALSLRPMRTAWELILR